MNEEKKMITIITEDGIKEEVELLVAFKLETNNKEYVIYTKNEKDENDNTTIYASALEDVDGKKQLTGIKSDEEWQKIKEIIKELARVK